MISRRQMLHLCTLAPAGAMLPSIASASRGVPMQMSGGSAGATALVVRFVDPADPQANVAVGVSVGTQGFAWAGKHFAPATEYWYQDRPLEPASIDRIDWQLACACTPGDRLFDALQQWVGSASADLELFRVPRAPIQWSPTLPPPQGRSQAFFRGEDALTGEALGLRLDVDERGSLVDWVWHRRSATETLLFETHSQVPPHVEFDARGTQAQGGWRTFSNRLNNQI